ncbi:MAG: hypothetical protein NWE89_03350 [Candidatus Bathyarchaeota archaeon]|nr:hypothetical protein [Candidatus Bathyarchaeota archaeon]
MYSTATEVRTIIHTSLTDAMIENIIELSDTEIDKRLGPQDASDKVIKKLSILTTARTIKQRQPDSVAVGEYKETAGDIQTTWSQEITALLRLYTPSTVAASTYQHVDEERRYVKKP